MMRLETNRLIITEFNLSMAESVHINSLDDDNRNFLPDEVFETVEIAKETIVFLMSVYESKDGPLVYPILLKNGIHIGHVQLVPIETGYEVGYHIGKLYTCNGYATEALNVFLKFIKNDLHINKVYGVCVVENYASIKVLEKCGFYKEFEGLGKYQGDMKNIVRYVFE